MQQIVSKHILSKFIPVTILFVTVFSIVVYSRPDFPVLSKLDITSLWWFFIFIVLGVFTFSRYYFFDKENESNILFVKYYLFWNIICIIRGMFVVEMYWDWKGLITNTMALILPVLAYSATNIKIVQSTLSFYVKYVLPLFVLFIVLIRPDAYGFYLVPISFLALFIPALTKRQKIVLLFFITVVLVSDLAARSNVIKFGVPLLILLIYYFRSNLSIKILEKARIILFILPLILFTLAVSNVFNVFKINEYLEGEYTVVGTDNDGNRVELEVTTDTRTFLYSEVITSAIKYNYWLFGRTPARGNESFTFGALDYELTRRFERLANEVGILNVFTWTGIIGVILYFLVFFRATYLAVNRSNNIYAVMLGVFIAFRWFYSWIEDVNNFSLNYFMLWIMIGLCLSQSFRKMTNNEVTIWVRGIFDSRYLNFKQFKKLNNGNE